MEKEYDFQNDPLKNDEFNSFRVMLKDRDAGDIDKIITRYISYKPEMAEAALYIAVEKGMMPYELKEKITRQIHLNYSGKSKYVKQTVWEKDNAFHDYVAGYSDDRIYELIDDPSEIVIDVYHALLTTARERELISEEDFRELFGEGIINTRTDKEIINDELNQMIGDIIGNEPDLTDEQAGIYQNKYWKCPSCNELVENDFEICWNCQAEKPAVTEQPAREEIINVLRKENYYSTVKSGFALMAAGILVFALSFLRLRTRHIPWNERYITLAITGMFIIAGIVFIILDLAEKKEKK